MDNIVANSPVNPLIPTIFHEPWWLDIVTRGQFKFAEVKENGKVIGRLPYYTYKHLGLVRSTMPPLTHFLGPAIDEGQGDDNARFMKRNSVTHELIKQLPYIPIFYIKCHRGITDVIAFQGEGFRSSVQFTHEIHPQAEDIVWNKMHSKRRSAISRAQKELSATVIEDPKELFRFNEENLKAYGLTSIYDLAVFHRLVATCLEKKQGRILAARDDKGDFISATFCVWDHKSYYFLMGTRKQNSARGSLSLLAWEAIKHAMQKNLIFDLDGIGNDDSVAFYSSFGATIAPRYIVTRENQAGRIFLAVRSLCKKEQFYF